MSLDAALDYLHRGWCPVPIIVGKKSPTIDDWTNVAPDEDLIRQWWGRWPRSGVGLVTGAPSGFFVVDVDIAEGKRGDDTLADLEHQHGKLPHTVEVVTGSHGRHIYLRSPVPVTNSAGNVLGPGLDIRGDGGQVLAPPTVHPNGRTYEWEASSHPDDTPIAEAPEWLVRLLTSAPNPAQRKAQRRPARHDDTAPGNRFAAAVTWPQLLEADGARYLGTRVDRVSGEPYELWSRPPLPGEDNFEPHTSATLYYRGSDVLKVFTSNWRGADPDTGAIWQLQEGETYTRFGYFATRYYGGDYAAAAGDLARQQTAADVNDWLDNLNPQAATPDRPAEGWLTPLPLGAGDPTLPPFPLDTLPDWVAAHCESVARRIQVAVDLPAHLALCALAIAATSRITLEVNTGWTEHCNLYLAVALPPGEGKSPAESATIGPLRDFEAELVAQLRPTILEVETRKRLAEKRAKTAEDRYQRSGEQGDQDAAIQAVLDADAIEVPPSPRLVTGDATPEALTRLIATHRRMAIVSTEGGVFDLMVGRYSDSSNLDVYLQAWSGDSITVDRIGRPSDNVPEALLTIGVTVQPHVIRKLADRPELAGRGLTARFMYSVPTPLAGRRDARSQVVDTPARDAETVYTERLVDLARRWWGWQTPAQLKLSEPAREAAGDWWAALETRLAVNGDLSPMGEWVGKLRTTVFRVAALLHLADGNSHNQEVEAATMRRAIAVGDYWVAHARAVHALWDTTAVVEQAQKVLAWAREQDGEFNTRDCYRGLRRTFERASDLVPALELLMDHGYVRPLFKGRLEVGIRGRQSPRFEVHPLVTTRDNVANSAVGDSCPNIEIHEIKEVGDMATVVPIRDVENPSLSLSKSERASPPSRPQTPSPTSPTDGRQIPSAAELLEGSA